MEGPKLEAEGKLTALSGEVSGALGSRWETGKACISGPGSRGSFCLITRHALFRVNFPGVLCLCILGQGQVEIRDAMGTFMSVCDSPAQGTDQVLSLKSKNWGSHRL